MGRDVVLGVCTGEMSEEEYKKMAFDAFDSQFIAKKEPQEKIVGKQTYPLGSEEINLKKTVLSDLVIDKWNGLGDRGVPVDYSTFNSAIYTFPDEKPFGESVFVQDYSGRDIIAGDLKKFYGRFPDWRSQSYDCKDFPSLRKDVIKNTGTQGEIRMLKTMLDIRANSFQ